VAEQPDPAQSLLEAYDIEPEGPSVAGAPEGEAESGTPPRPTPPKDPETGRFVKAVESGEEFPERPAPKKGIVRLAKRLGLSEEDISTADNLEELVAHLTEQRLATDHLSDLGRQPASQSGEPGTSAETITSPADDLGLGEDQFDEALVGAFKKLQTRIQQLEARQTRAEGFMAQTQAIKAHQQIDIAFEKHEGLFGKGAGSEMDKDSPEFKRRVAVLREAESYDKRLPIAQRINKAVKTLYPSQPAEAEPAEPKQQRNGIPWQEAGLAVPTSRAASPEKPSVRKAERSVAAWKQANSQQHGATQDEADEDFLP
jgi:hypothetical protein